MKNRPPTSPHAWTPERAERIMEAMKHPDAADLNNACDQFEAAVRKLRDKPVPTAGPGGKTAIMTAFFGSTVPSALKAYDVIEDAVRRKFPGVPLFRAYSSRIVRRKRGNDVPSPAVRLHELQLAGYDTVHILAGFLTPGEEYQKLRRTAEIFALRQQVTVTMPPLSDPETLRGFLTAVRGVIPPDRSGKVLFMGHGNTDGRSAFAYMAAAAELKKISPAISLACVEGEPLDTPLIESFSGDEVLLIPFMLVAGDHALNDLAGDGPGSWKSRLEKRGCRCSAILHGLGELPSVAEYFAASLPGK